MLHLTDTVTDMSRLFNGGVDFLGGRRWGWWGGTGDWGRGLWNRNNTVLRRVRLFSGEGESAQKSSDVIVSAAGIGTRRIILQLFLV